MNRCAEPEQSLTFFVLFCCFEHQNTSYYNRKCVYTRENLLVDAYIYKGPILHTSGESFENYFGSEFSKLKYHLQPLCWWWGVISDYLTTDART